MLPYLILIVISLNMAGCGSAIKEKDDDIQIVIKDASSYTYEVTDGFYTVHRLEKPDTVISFHLTVNERAAIIDKYYKLNIDGITEIDKETGNTFIKDKCSDMPKTYTRLVIKLGIKQQEIMIDNSCESFYPGYYFKARRIKRFIDFTKEIINKKPGIKAAPESDFWYI